MPERFERLAIYNAEVSRGIVHTEAFVARMRLLQVEFDDWAEGIRFVDVFPSGKP